MVSFSSLRPFGRYRSAQVPNMLMMTVISFFFSDAAFSACARVAVARRGPKWLEIEKETTHVIVRWTQVDGVTLHDGTPRSAPVF